MSLRIYFKGEDFIQGGDVVHDVEMEFSKIKLKGTPLEKLLIRQIEQGEYLDSISFVDRFGFKLFNDNMSTGCKAALCVANLPDKIVELTECGLNARDAIITNCKEGGVLIEDNTITFKGSLESIDVQVDNYVISTIDRLNKYIQWERPFEPDLGTGGIRCLT